MGRPLKGTRPVTDPSLTDNFWRDLTGNSEPSQRDQFLWLSIHLVRELGLNQFKITTVAKMLGYSVAMVNHHFGSRDGLIAECAEMVHQNYSLELIDATEAADRNPRARLEAYIKARVVCGRQLGGWTQVLNYPFHSFESPTIALARAGVSFENSFFRNLMFITQLVLDLQKGTVSESRPDREAFANELMTQNPTAIFHASNIGTATAGAVMWMSGRIDVFGQPQEIVDLANAALEWQVQHLVNSIPVA
jgi:AcrR family transcriptional regulator